MIDERYLELKKQGIYKKQANMLLALNDFYHKYLYLYTFSSIENEKERLLSKFK